MKLLLADAQPQTRSVSSTLVSLMLHAAVVVAVVFTGQRVATAVAQLLEESVQYLYPAPRDIGSLRPGQLSEAAPRDPRTAGDATPRWRDGQPGTGGQGVGAHEGIIFAPLPSESESVEPGIGDNAFSFVEVDSVAVVDPTSAGPEYPTAMANRKLEGSAVLRFVVDSTGLIDMSTVRVISASHSAFAKAVLIAMPRMKYRPASIDGHPVRLLVEQAFSFRIQKPKGPIA